jgi:hypothetical protein
MFSYEVIVRPGYELRQGIVGSRGLERMKSRRLQGSVDPYGPWNTVTIRYIETSGSDYPLTQGHIPEETQLKLTPLRKPQNSYEGVSKIFRTEAVIIINLATKGI